MQTSKRVGIMTDFNLKEFNLLLDLVIAKQAYYILNHKDSQKHNIENLRIRIETLIDNLRDKQI